MTQRSLFESTSPWHQVAKFDPRAAVIADRHYSRQSVGDKQFLPPGRTLALLVDDERGRALWGVCDNLDPEGTRRFRCTVFRNESSYLSSDLVRLATTATLERWHRRGWSAPPPDH